MGYVSCQEDADKSKDDFWNSKEVSSSDDSYTRHSDGRRVLNVQFERVQEELKQAKARLEPLQEENAKLRLANRDLDWEVRSLKMAALKWAHDAQRFDQLERDLVFEETRRQQAEARIADLEELLETKQQEIAALKQSLSEHQQANRSVTQKLEKANRKLGQNARNVNGKGSLKGQLSSVKSTASTETTHGKKSQADSENEVPNEDVMRTLFGDRKDFSGGSREY